MRGVRLAELMAQRQRTVDPKACPNEEFDLYSIPAFDSSQPEVLLGREIGSTKQVVEPGDVLLSKIVPHIRRSWIVGKSNGRRTIASSEWIVFRGRQFDPSYLRHLLVGDSFHAEFMRTVSGVGGSLLRARPSYVGEIKIPLPSLSEQRRIAEVLDRAEALRAKRRAALAQLDTLTQAIFLDMFGDPATNPRRWPKISLGEHTSKIGSGATPLGGDASYKSSGIALIRSMNVRDGYFLKDGLAFIDDGQAAKLDGVTVQEGDVLLNITGASVARVCRAPAYVLPARVNQHVSIIRPDKTLDAVYLEQLLLSQSIKRRLLRIASSGATRQAITKNELDNFAIMCPPESVQRQFADIAANISRLRNKQNAAQDESDALFASLQDRAFRGEL
jgi:type I restriction enzyme S subunit